MMNTATKRTFLIGLLGVGGVGALGIGDYATASPFDFFKSFLHTQMPGVRIPDSTVHDFTIDALHGRHDSFEPKAKLLASVMRVTGYENAAKVLRKKPEFVGFEREFITRFLLGSNYFELHDATKEDVTYFGQPTNCSNPFAIVDPPGDEPPRRVQPVRPPRHALRRAHASSAR
jgi:hypothetical protein